MLVKSVCIHSDENEHKLRLWCSKLYLPTGPLGRLFYLHMFMTTYDLSIEW